MLQPYLCFLPLTRSGVQKVSSVVPVLLYLCLLYQNHVIQKPAPAFPTARWIRDKQKFLRWDSQLMLVRQVVTSETLRCFTLAEMLALYSCMCTYIYPAYIIVSWNVFFFFSSQKISSLTKLKFQTLIQTQLLKKMTFSSSNEKFILTVSKPFSKRKSLFFCTLLQFFFPLKIVKKKTQNT